MKKIYVTATIILTVFCTVVSNAYAMRIKPMTSFYHRHEVAGHGKTRKFKRGKCRYSVSQKNTPSYYRYIKKQNFRTATN